MFLESDEDFFDLVEANLVTRAVVQLCRPMGFVTCDGLGVLERALIVEVDRDPRGAEAVTADGSGEASLPRPAFDHS